MEKETYREVEQVAELIAIQAQRLSRIFGKRIVKTALTLVLNDYDVQLLNAQRWAEEVKRQEEEAAQAELEEDRQYARQEAMRNLPPEMLDRIRLFGISPNIAPRGLSSVYVPVCWEQMKEDIREQGFSNVRQFELFSGGLNPARSRGMLAKERLARVCALLNKPQSRYTEINHEH